MGAEVESRQVHIEYSPEGALDSAKRANLVLPASKEPSPISSKTFVLNSWKEIAAYLGRGVRTVQRWELESGLPVHRPQGKDRSAVLAIPEELDEWLGRTPVRSAEGGNGSDDGAASDSASALLELARELLAQGERLVQLDHEHRAEAENLVASVREIVRELGNGNGAATDDSARARKNNANGARLILSVDDEPALLYTQGKILEGEGYQVLSAADGPQALQIFAAHAIDIVLLDYKMPGMDGGMVAQRMKQSKPQVPIIMVSANYVPKEVLAYVHCLITKGEGPKPLLEKIRQLLAPQHHARSA